jgi:hypothetical protein
MNKKEIKKEKEKSKKIKEQTTRPFPLSSLFLYYSENTKILCAHTHHRERKRERERNLREHDLEHKHGRLNFVQGMLTLFCVFLCKPMHILAMTRP